MPVCANGDIVIDSSLCPEMESNIGTVKSNTSYVVLDADGNYWVDGDGNKKPIPEPDLNEGLNNPDIETIQPQYFNNELVEQDSTHEPKTTLISVLVENGRHVGQQMKVQNDILKKQVEASNYSNELLLAVLQLQSDSISLIKDFVKEFRLLNQIKSTELKNQKENNSVDLDFKVANVIQENDKIVEMKKIGESAEAKKEEIEFNKNGQESLVNSNGIKITPRIAKALADSELAFQKGQENQVDVIKMLEELEKEDNEDENALVSLLQEAFNVSDADIKLMDDLNKINGGA